MEMIEESRFSLCTYAYLRILEWREPLLTHSQQVLPELLRELGAEPRPSSSVPTELVLTQDGRLHRPHYNGHVQEHIDENMFETHLWEPGHAANTTLRHPNRTRALCGSRKQCECTLASLAGTAVELHETQKTGVGVRNLSRFKKGDTLDAYAGEVHPLDTAPTSDYAVLHYGIGMGKRLPKSNWTRFVNHSCKDQSVAFTEKTVGDRTLPAVVAERDIDMFQELTISYVKHYWLSGEDLLCESDNCHSKVEKKLPWAMVSW